VQPGAGVELGRVELDAMSRQCTDGSSTARIEKLRAACFPKLAALDNTRRDARRTIRAKYVTQVSELLLDPQFAPLVDAYNDVRDSEDPGSRDKQRQTLGALDDLAKKHGIEPGYAQELDLW
jgi:hypothetical protein